MSLSRQMRHYGMRVIISSQGMGRGLDTREIRAMNIVFVEPTVVPPVLLDLCSVAFMHRFSSQSWWDHVSKHFSADLTSAFDEIVRLKVCPILGWSPQRLITIANPFQTGQAIVLAPSALAMLRKSGQPTSDPKLYQLGRRYMLVKVRKRVTKDGGASVLVV